MFDIGWSEYALIAVVALIAIGPKELPGVLRMVGQWVGKARKMAGEFQGQFREAMREAEMADLKKSFDDVREAATGFANGDVMTSLQRDVNSALGTDPKPATTETTSSASSTETATPSPETPPSEPLAITPDKQAESAVANVTSSDAPSSVAHHAAVESDASRDAKAS